jgi:hypothetical protein
MAHCRIYILIITIYYILCYYTFTNFDQILVVVVAIFDFSHVEIWYNSTTYREQRSKICQIYLFGPIKTSQNGTPYSLEESLYLYWNEIGLRLLVPTNRNAAKWDHNLAFIAQSHFDSF